MMLHEPLATLATFRRDLYGCFDRRADALFELTDALLTADPIASPAYLSLEPVHRRGWGSLYAALARGHINDAGLRALLGQHPLADGQPIYAVDVSVWPRCDAETSPGRGYYYHPSRHSAGQPIVAGWAYQWIAQLGFERVEALVHRLPQSGTALFVFDAGYDPVRLQRNLEGYRAQILVRLQSGRMFYADPPIPKRQPIGRPCRHGEKSDSKNPSTWPVGPTATTDARPAVSRVASRGCANHEPYGTYGTGLFKEAAG